MGTQTPKIILVVAVSENGVIGIDNMLPWHLPHDLQHFKALTLHQHILMGRKTYESIGRPLPEREMIVLTRSLDFTSSYAQIIHSPKMLFPLQHDLYVIGGAEIYALFRPWAHCIEMTLVKTTLTGDAFFPLPSPDEWRETSRIAHPADERHAFAYDFIRYETY
jgi:dihydrofolate reductase